MAAIEERAEEHLMAVAAARGSNGTDPLLARFRRLTARETRLLILSADGHSHSEAAQALGVSPGNVANSLSRVRRKLGVPRGQKLNDFLGKAPELADVLTPLRGAEPVSDTRDARRRRDVLRVTIGELQRLGAVTRRRAAALHLLGGDPTDQAVRREEVAMIDRIADLIDDAVEQALREARREHRREPGDVRR